jgi:dihydroorotase
MTAEPKARMQPFDLLLKGGRVIDPANGRDALLDVAIGGKQIAAVDEHIPAEAARQVVDASGLVVTPGIIDMHTHVFRFAPVPVGAYVDTIHADAHMLASGVTTAVDTGTAGWKNFMDFKTGSIDGSTVRILAFLNIAGGGMLDDTSEQDPVDMEPHVTAALAGAFPEIIVGIKTAHYWTRQPWDASHPYWASVERAVQAGEICGKPVMVDFWPRPPERSYPELILEKLRPGDIHTHVFAQQFPVLDEHGKVQPYMRQARTRGVIFDLGHGAGSFWFRQAIPAWRDGFPPDSLSTDLHMGNINGPVLSMATTMSKYLSMGMPLPEVIMRSTVAPAREIGHPELGTLSVGAEADVAVFRDEHGEFGFTDCGRAKMIGHGRLACALTVRAGKIVFDPTGLSMPEWESAPAEYWRTPELQSKDV